MLTLAKFPWVKEAEAGLIASSKSKAGKAEGLGEAELPGVGEAEADGLGEAETEGDGEGLAAKSWFSLARVSLATRPVAGMAYFL